MLITGADIVTLQLWTSFCYTKFTSPSVDIKFQAGPGGESWSAFGWGMALVALLIPSSLLIAQQAPVKICITSHEADAAPETGQRLADALSQQKLRSGRSLEALSLSAKSPAEISQQVQSNGCEYVVNLQGWKTQQGGTDVPSSLSNEIGSGAPQDAATRGASARYRPDAEWPALNYDVVRVGEKHPIAKGTQLYRRRYAGHRAMTYNVDYPALAARIAREIT